MNRVLLNADVLLLIFVLANKQAKLALMSTCKALYREGGKQFLKSEEVNLQTETGLRSFLWYMAADGGSRMRFLRRLDLDLENPSRSILRQLTKTISHLIPVSGLTHLEIHSPERLLCAHPPLSQAIAQLTTLENITLHTAGERTLDMVRSMRSRPRTVYIAPDPTASERLNGGAPWDALVFLRQFSSSLRDLTVAGGAATVDPGVDGPQYPLVSRLFLEEPVAPTTWHYARAFPNLRQLAIVGTERGTDEAEAAGYARFRAANGAGLRAHGCWAALDAFEGTLLMLWLLALPCPVRRLNLCDDCEVGPDMFRDAFGAARATCLDFYFYQFSLFLDEEITQAFAEGCGDTLKELGLTLRINSDEYLDREDELDLDDVLDAIMEMLCSFSALESVVLCIDFQGEDPNMDMAGPEGHERMPGEVSAEDMDIDVMCAALHDAVPSAKHVQFTLQNHWKRGTVTVEIGSEGSGSG